MQLQLQHSKPGTRPSALSIDQGYLADFVKRLSFPRVYGTAANAKAEVMVADEFLRMFGACDRVGNTRNVCFGWPAEARILIGAVAGTISSLYVHVTVSTLTIKPWMLGIAWMVGIVSVIVATPADYLRAIG